MRKSALLLVAVMLLACGDADGVGDDDFDIVDIPSTPVERQAIGNCWLYAAASWVEALHLARTGETFDVSQSYWTYWHLYSQIVFDGVDEIDTGGTQKRSGELIAERGLMDEATFLTEDANAEMSFRQSSALREMIREMDRGRLTTAAQRSNGTLVREVLDEAFRLEDDVRAQLDEAFGNNGRATYAGGDAKGVSKIWRAVEFPVRYTELKGFWSTYSETVDTSLQTAIDTWQIVEYPDPDDYWTDRGVKKARRKMMIRLQRAMHDLQPVAMTWDVDFNALEEKAGHWRRGSFNTATLKAAGGAGLQGGHIVVVEDYQVYTQKYGLLKAGVEVTDPAKLKAALDYYSAIDFVRIKNSWGALRDDRAFSDGMPGYHDLWMDYLDGPIAWCPEADEKTLDNGDKVKANCNGESRPLRKLFLPPGY